MPEFSICIPSYEMGGQGVIFLKELLESIQNQDFDNYEIIVSDHSINNDIQDLCLEYQKVVYYKNDKDRGNGAANLNNSILNSTGKYVKIMCQDDLIISRSCLSKLKEVYDSENVNWIVSGCCHTNDGINYEKEIYPVWSPYTLYGDNQIGSPSVCSFKKESFIEFDIFYTLLYDVDFYYRMVLKNEMPFFLNEILIAIRKHKNQTTNITNNNVTLSNGNWNWGIPQEEYDYILKKYGQK